MAEQVTQVLGIVGIKNMGTYNPETYYEKLNVVTYNGSSYCAKTNVVGVAPTNTEYWQLYAEKGDKGETGDTGPQGPKPVKGVDYYTQEDKAEISNEISTDVADEVSTQVGSLTSATPLIASSTSDMNDTTRIYVNITDGKWYYYNGTAWTAGGVYQSTGIADNSITIFKLDELLQNNFTKEYNNVNFEMNTDGFCKIAYGEFVIDDNNEYKYGVVNLDNNTIYEFTGFNYFYLCGLIVTDNEDNIIYSTREQSSAKTGSTPVHLIFKTNQPNLKAYISKGLTDTAWTDFMKNNIILNKFDNITPNYKNNNLEYLKNVDGAFIARNSTLNNIPVETSGEDTNYKIYKMNKGISYSIKTANLWQVAGIVITDNDYKVKYCSSSSYHNTIEYIDYDFTATDDGYIFLSNVPERFTPTIELNNYFNFLINKLEGFENNNLYTGKKWAAMGDSLTDKNTLGTNVNNYFDYVKNKLDLNATNYGHGGSGYKARYAYNQAFYQIAETLDSDVNVITIFGSFNDTYTTLNNFPFGTIDDTTTDTIFGSMNVTFDTLIENYPNAVIGVIIPTPWSDRNSINCTDSDMEKAETYVSGLKQICEKRSIPYLDLYTKSNLYPWDSTFNSLFFKNSDGCHPNTNGHKKIAGQIEQFIKRILY